MSIKRPVREPKQSRGKNSKEKIIETAYNLFCERGYYKTTTIHIAKAAGISIGCLYSYFKNKNAIYYEVLKRRNRKFFEIFTEQIDRSEVSKIDKKEWLKVHIKALVDAQEKSKKLHDDIYVLYYSDHNVADIVSSQQKKGREIATEFLNFFKDEVKVQDFEAAAIVFSNMISSITEEIAYKKSEVDKKRILNEGVEAILKYLFR